MLYYNPLDEFCKNPTGAVKENEEVVFRIKCNSNKCALVITKDGSNCSCHHEMIKKDGYFEISLCIDVGLYWYYFDMCNGEFVGKGENFLGELSRYPQGFQLTVSKSNYCVPSWLKGGIIYQIFPDRFCRAEKKKKVSDEKVLHAKWGETPIYQPNHAGQVLNNDFFGGDFKGIIKKLPYLKKLNVTAIYLNHIFKAYSNHRYDTGDYMTIDPLLGTEEDFKDLISKADELGIKIILDGVFNHSGDDSLYFNRYGRYDSKGAYQCAASKYKNWFKFTDYPKEYESWWGIRTLPAYNKTCPELVDFITGENGVIEKYTKMGIGGWRLDVVDELPSSMVKKIRSAVKKVNQDGIVIGEVWEDASNKISYGVRREYFLGEELDSVMNYPLKNAIINLVTTGETTQFVQVVSELVDHYPKAVLDSLMNILSTHDTYRILSSISGINTAGLNKKAMENLTVSGVQLETAKTKLKMATLLQFTVFGVPSIYYGDEVGMQGFADPLNRRCYPWRKGDAEVLSWYRKLSKIRSKYSAFADGKFKLLYGKNGAVVYSRSNDESEVLVSVNAGDTVKVVSFDGKLYNVLNGKYYESNFELLPNSFAIFVRK